MRDAAFRPCRVQARRLLNQQRAEMCECPLTSWEVEAWTTKQLVDELTQTYARLLQWRAWNAEAGLFAVVGMGA